MNCNATVRNLTLPHYATTNGSFSFLLFFSSKTGDDIFMIIFCINDHISAKI